MTMTEYQEQLDLLENLKRELKIIDTKILAAANFKRPSSASDGRYVDPFDPRVPQISVTTTNPDALAMLGDQPALLSGAELESLIAAFGDLKARRETLREAIRTQEHWLRYHATRVVLA